MDGPFGLVLIERSPLAAKGPRPEGDRGDLEFSLYPFEVILPVGLPVTGAVLSDQVKSLDWRARRAKRICVLSPLAVLEILQKLDVLLA